MFHVSFMDDEGQTREFVVAARDAESAKRAVLMHSAVATWLFVIPVDSGTLFAVNY